MEKTELYFKSPAFFNIKYYSQFFENEELISTFIKEILNLL